MTFELETLVLGTCYSWLVRYRTTKTLLVDGGVGSEGVAQCWSLARCLWCLCEVGRGKGVLSGRLMMEVGDQEEVCPAQAGVKRVRDEEGGEVGREKIQASTKRETEYRICQLESSLQQYGGPYSHGPCSGHSVSE
jgi:hypothetical protein